MNEVKPRIKNKHWHLVLREPWMFEALTWKPPVKQKGFHRVKMRRRDMLIYLLWKRGGLSNREIVALSAAI
jgi:hypothetical protein